MNEEQFQPEQEVREVLEQYPQVIPVFLRHHMSCVGCSMSAFETLSSAAQIYHLSLDDFLTELRKEANGS